MPVNLRARMAQCASRPDSNDRRRMRAMLFAALLSSVFVARAQSEEASGDPTQSTKQVAAVAEAEPAKAADVRQTDVAAKSRPQVPARLIGATTIVTEVASGLPFAARVDTGATSCSIHCEAIEIKDATENPKENIGKSIRFLVKNKEGESEWVESKIVDHVTVRTAAKNEERYKVRLKLRWEDVEKKVLVTLNDRQHMRYPLLIGRNFLRDDFLVNVSLNSEPPSDAE